MNAKLKKALYESIMKSVAKTVKSKLNESSDMSIDSLKYITDSKMKRNVDGIIFNAGKAIAKNIISSGNSVSDNEQLLELIHDTIENMVSNSNNDAIEAVTIAKLIVKDNKFQDVEIKVNGKNLVEELDPSTSEGKESAKYILIGFFTELLANDKELNNKVKQYISEFKK